MLESIKSTLTRKLRKKALREAYILGVAQQVISHSGQVVSLKDGRLKIICQDSLVGYALATRQEKLIELINKQLKEPFISRIVIEIKI